MTLHGDMIEYLHQAATDDPETLARGFVSRVSDPSGLLPLVADEFRRLQRDEARMLENRAMRELAATPPPKRGKGRTGAVTFQIPGSLQALLDESYSYQADLERKKLRFMTVADHEARIDMLLAQRAGLDRAIEFSRTAIELIERAGVSCLDDLDSAGTQAA